MGRKYKLYAPGIEMSWKQDLRTEERRNLECIVSGPANMGACWIKKEVWNLCYYALLLVVSRYHSEFKLSEALADFNTNNIS